MEETQKIRAFVSLDAPTEWKEQLRQLLGELHKQFSKSVVSWANPDQLHITLRFLGYIQANEIPAVARGMDRATLRCAKFTFLSDRMGCFPGPRRPRVLWIGVKENGEESRRLFEEVVRATRDIGKEPEDRPFTPHLTLGRFKNLSPADGKLFEEICSNPLLTLPDWNVSEVLLMRSHPGRSGARYEVLHASRLGAGSA